MNTEASIPLAPQLQRRRAGGNRATVTVLVTIVGCVAATALIGWTLDVEVLRSVLPGLTAMNPATAIAFIIAAAALLLPSSTGRSRRAGFAATACAMAVAAIGADKLIEVFSGWGIGLDELLFAASLRGNQMAPNTAANFVLLGCALALLDARLPRGLRPAQVLALAVSLVALLALIGYLYDVQGLYVVGRHIGMAMHTAVAFMLCAAAVFLVRPGVGLMALLERGTLAGMVLRRLLPAAAVVPVVMGWLRLLGEDAGLYDTHVGIALYAISTIVLLTVLIWNCGVHLARADRQRNEAMAAALRSEERYRSLTLASSQIVWAGNAAGQMDPPTESWCVFTGQSAREAAGHGCANAIHPDDRAAAAARWAAAVETGLYVDEYRVRRRDGEYRLMAARGVALRGADGAIAEWIGTMADVTDRRQAERAVRDAKEAAERANSAKSNFLANMSHEIRTPMAAILGYADLLLDPEQSPSDRLNGINIIRRNGQHLLNVINDILDLSKIEAGKMTVERVACQPWHIVGDVASLMRARATEKKLDFHVRCEGRLPATIQGDPTRLRQVLINLLSNAIKFTARGRVELVVSLCDAGSPVPRLRFEVLDTGTGMTADQLARIFQPFTQGDDSTTRKFGGTGLGLMISKSLCEMLGGELSVQSVAGVGSRFTVTVPTGPLDGVALLDHPHEAIAAAAAAADAQASSSAARIAGRVLLVDDGIDNQQLLSHYLVKAGADVTVAENGRVACDKALAATAAGEPFDLVLMDMQMPELDGYGATAALRSKGFARPIVALTANAMAEDREKCLRCGCTDYLSKPVARAQLIETVARQLARAAETDTVAVTAPPLSSSADDPDVARFLATYVAQLPDQVEQITAALRERDIENLKAVLHRIKGTAGLYGFMPITELAGQLEKRVATQPADESVAREVEALARLIRSVSGYSAQASTPRQADGRSVAPSTA